MKKALFISICVVASFLIAYMILSRQIPMSKYEYKVGSEYVYFKETSRSKLCDIAYFDIILYEDQYYQYSYELISIGNGSCKSELYVWHKLKYYTLSEALEKNIITIDEFIESEFVIRKAVTIDE